MSPLCKDDQPNSVMSYPLNIIGPHQGTWFRYSHWLLVSSEIHFHHQDIHRGQIAQSLLLESETDTQWLSQVWTTVGWHRARSPVCSRWMLAKTSPRFDACPHYLELEWIDYESYWKGRIGFALGLEGVRQYLNWNWKGGIGGWNKCMTGWRPKRPRMP